MAVVSRYERISLDGSSKSFFVAVKRIRAQFQHLDHYLRLFEKECENVSFISSANLVHVYGVEVIDGFKSIVMEWVDGCSLDDLLDVLANQQLLRAQFDRDVWFSQKVITHIVRCLLHGLKDIHTYKDKDGELQCLIHRDVSPSNVLLAVTGEVKLADFGISKLGRASKFVTTGRPGTLGYMAPERLVQGEIKYDQSVDLYAVGAILFELICQQPYAQWAPAPGLSIKEKHSLVREHLTARGSSFSELAVLAYELLEPDPKDRIGSALVALDRIKALPLDAEGRHELSEMVRMAAEDVRRRRKLDQVDQAGSDGIDADSTNIHGSTEPSVDSEMPSPPPQVDVPSTTVAGVMNEGAVTVRTGAGDALPQLAKPSRIRLATIGAAVILAGVAVTQTSDCRTNETESAAYAIGSQSADAMHERTSMGPKVSGPGASTDDEPESRERVQRFVQDTRQNAEARLSSVLASIKETDEKERETLMADLGDNLARYLQFTSPPDVPVDWTLYCDFLTESQAVLPNSPRLCPALREQVTTQLGSVNATVGLALRSAIAKSPRDSSIVNPALAELVPWNRGKVDLRVESLFKSLRKKFPGRVPGSDTLSDTRGTASGFSFAAKLPAYFTPRAWRETVRELACEDLRALRALGWVHALTPDEARTIELRGRFFSSYDQAWRSWLSSIQWERSSSKRRNLKTLSAMGNTKVSPLNHLKAMVQANGEIPEWHCDGEPKQEPFQISVLADLNSILQDQDLEGRYAAYADMLAKSLRDGPASLGRREVLDARIAKLEQATSRSFEGSQAQLHASLHGALSRPFQWARSRIEVSSPSASQARSKASAPRASELARRWCEKIQGPFERDFANRYPFKKSGRSTANLQKIRGYFHPSEGALWREVASLAGYVERKGNRFVLRENRDPKSPGLSRQAVLFLNKAWIFAQSMFPEGQAKAQLSFELALRDGQNVKGAQLIVGDSVFVQGGAGGTGKRLTWPHKTGTSASLTAQSSAAEAGSKTLLIRANKREWSLFWLLEQGRVLSDGFGVARLGWSSSTIPNSMVHAEIRLIGSSSLFFGPQWAPVSFLRVLRIRAPKSPLTGKQAC